MRDQKIVVIGASAGGVEALMGLVRGLLPQMEAPVLIVIHVPPDIPTHLPEILSRLGPLPAKLADDQESALNGTIYIAPPDHHLTIAHGLRLRVVRDPREHWHRPAVNPLFRSAAMTAGPNAIGVILSGALDDGTEGLIAIKKEGGIAIVQDPKDATFSGMPESAIEHVAVDHILPLKSIAAQITQIVASM